ncbi:MAG: hypothetical protein WBO73_11950 [Gammaproteobacteria bacterium]
MPVALLPATGLLWPTVRNRPEIFVIEADYRLKQAADKGGAYWKGRDTDVGGFRKPRLEKEYP